VQGELHGIKDRKTDGTAVRTASVVGNLPYYITSDILLRLFDYHRNFDQIVIMVQKEVADRIAAQPGTRDYGLLTVTAQLFADIEKLFTLPPGAFSPAPKVYSSVLRLKVAPKAKHLGVHTADFIAFLKSIFGQKRKTLTNNLKDSFPKARIAAALESAGLKADIRAEAVGIEKLAQLFLELK
jgi:16S rRNA (adenine1518-N6/adenine1519-N6)-dimethyltransferase